MSRCLFLFPTAAASVLMTDFLEVTKTLKCISQYFGGYKLKLVMGVRSLYVNFLILFYAFDF